MRQLPRHWERRVGLRHDTGQAIPQVHGSTLALLHGRPFFGWTHLDRWAWNHSHASHCERVGGGLRGGATTFAPMTLPRKVTGRFKIV